MKYEELGAEVGILVDKKQAAYGDSFGNSHKILEVLYPNGVSIEQYPDMLTMARIIDKLFRLANQKDAFEESPYRDIAGYALLGIARDERFSIALKERLKEVADNFAEQDRAYEVLAKEYESEVLGVNTTDVIDSSGRYPWHLKDDDCPTSIDDEDDYYHG